ncbi:MAG: hypothetical protein HQM13_21795 [SAR324 cluster bacterium]|nr:hypothetical protein [SAR324 cluster bacterium]
MLHIGFFGGKEEQVNALLEFHQKNKHSLFSRAHSLISRLEIEQSDDDLLIDVLFYLLPVSKLEGLEKAGHASLKWVRELRNYSSFCTRDSLKGCKHFLIGDVAEYFTQIEKMDLDMSARFLNESEWQPTVSIEHSYEEGTLIELPFLNAIVDRSNRQFLEETDYHNRHPQKGTPLMENSGIPFDEIAKLVFKKAPGGGAASSAGEWQLKSILMKAPEGQTPEKPHPVEELFDQESQSFEIFPQKIKAFNLRHSRRGRLSLMIESIKALRSEQSGVWSLELKDLWKIRNKTVPAGHFSTRIDTAVFEDFINDDASAVKEKLHQELLRVHARCEENIWQKYIDFQSISLHERPVLIAIAPDLAEILAKQIENIGFKNIKMLRSLNELEQAVLSCQVPGQRQDGKSGIEPLSEKPVFPTIITTENQQSEIRKKYPSLHCYGIPEFELNQSNNSQQKEEQEQIKKEAEKKLNEMLHEAAGNPLQTFYLKIVQLFLKFQFEENSSNLTEALQKMTRDFQKQLPSFFQAESERLAQQKKLKVSTGKHIAEMTGELAELTKTVPNQEQQIGRLNGMIQQKQSLFDKLTEKEQAVEEIKDEYNQLSSNRNELMQNAENLEKQKGKAKKELAAFQKQYKALLDQKEETMKVATKKSLFGGAANERIAEMRKKMIDFPQKKQALEKSISAAKRQINHLPKELDQIRGELKGSFDRFDELKKMVEGEEGKKKQSSQEVSAAIEKEEKELKMLLLQNEEGSQELVRLQARLQSQQKKIEMLSTDLIGREMAFKKEKQDAENFCNKIIAWVSSLSKGSDLKESLSQLGEETAVGSSEIKELMEMTNQLMALRKIQDENHSLVSVIMENLERELSFFHLPHLDELSEPLVFIGDRMNYPVFASLLFAKFRFKRKKGQVIKWEKFLQNKNAFKKKVILMDLSSRANDEVVIAKAYQTCFQQCLQNFMVILLPEDLLLEEKWQPFRSLALCLPAKNLNTFLAKPFFSWLDSVKELN